MIGRDEMDRPEDKQFKTQEELIGELMSRMDDVESVVLPIASMIQISNNKGMPPRNVVGVGGQIKYIGGESSIIHVEDMETMINNGVFNKMGIQIKLKTV